MDSRNTYESIQALKEGDIESFNRIYGQYHSIIYIYALKFVQRKSVAEEVTADVFITLWKKRAILNPELPIQSFLYKIAKDISYNYLKKVASTASLKEQYLKHYAIRKAKDGEKLLVEKEGLKRVNNVIETLPPKRLEIFKLKYYEGLGNKKIAARLGISINTVKVHLAKARLHLKERISKPHEMDLTIIVLSLIAYFL